MKNEKILYIFIVVCFLFLININLLVYAGLSFSLLNQTELDGSVRANMLRAFNHSFNINDDTQTNYIFILELIVLLQI